MQIVLSIVFTLAIIFIIPVVVYGIFSKFWGIKEPEKKLAFFLSVLIQKVGTSIGFVILFYLGRQYFVKNWLAYSMVWFVMFAIVETGQALAPAYSKKEALAGIISELFYFPLAASVAAKLLA